MNRRETFPFGYIILRFPKKSEQFIAREVLAFGSRCGPLLVYSLSEKEYDVDLPPGIRVEYLNRKSWGKIAAAHCYLMSKHPRRYFRTLFGGILFPYLRIRFSRHSAGKKAKSAKRTRQYLQAARIAADFARSGILHIHAHYAHLPAETALRVSGFTGIPYSFTAHAKDLFCAKRWRLSQVVRGAAFVITCTRDGLDYLRSVFKPRHHRKFVCIHHGLPLKLYRPDPGGKRRHGHPVMLSAGRFIAKKGFDVLLEALARLHRQGRRFRCVLAGDGRLSAGLRQQAAGLGIENCLEFPGFLSQSLLSRQYLQADLFVLACRKMPDGNRDGIPNVVLEAMASGLPVVSTRIGGIPEAVADGVTGFLVEEDDAEGLASALLRLLAAPKLREQMGNAGRELAVRKFDLDVNTGIFLRLMKKRSPRLRRYLEENSAAREIILPQEEARGRLLINKGRGDEPA